MNVARPCGGWLARGFGSGRARRRRRSAAAGASARRRACSKVHAPLARFCSVSRTTALRRAMRCIAARVASDGHAHDDSFIVVRRDPSVGGEPPPERRASTTTVDSTTCRDPREWRRGRPAARRIGRSPSDNSTSGLRSVSAPSSALSRKRRKPTLLFVAPSSRRRGAPVSRSLVIVSQNQYRRRPPRRRPPAAVVSRCGRRAEPDAVASSPLNVSVAHGASPSTSQNTCKYRSSVRLQTPQLASRRARPAGSRATRRSLMLMTSRSSSSRQPHRLLFGSSLCRRVGAARCRVLVGEAPRATCSRSRPRRRTPSRGSQHPRQSRRLAGGSPRDRQRGRVAELHGRAEEGAWRLLSLRRGPRGR